MPKLSLKNVQQRPQVTWTKIKCYASGSNNGDVHKFSVAVTARNAKQTSGQKKLFKFVLGESKN